MPFRVKEIQYESCNNWFQAKLTLKLVPNCKFIDPDVQENNN